MNFKLGIVLYNCSPNNIIKLCKEFDKINIILIDNKSKNIDDVKKIIKKYSNVRLIENKRNEGIAKALNQLMKECEKENIPFLLTLDQDSFIELNNVYKMLKYFNSKNVALVCPEVKDLNKNKNKVIKNDSEEVKRCITSGTIMNIKLCKSIGYFDEKMFIDYVDFDYCKRVSLNNYKIIKVKNCFLEHEIGKRTIRHFLWITVYPTNHKSERVYYQIRNMHYYCLKYRTKMTIKEKINELIRMFWKCLSIILYEENKKDKLRKAYKGFKDAYQLF